MVSCWGGYIHVEPVTSLRATQTSIAFRNTILFWRQHGVIIDTVRMDNQRSNELRSTFAELKLQASLVSPYDKAPNRAERAIRTCKNHIIAVRAGFHADCPHTYLDKGIMQIEMTLNTIHPFEYDPTISAYHAVHGAPYDFLKHPIAPVGTKVLTWDSPEHRGSWSDHGVPAIYMGPAMEHFRAFEVWVPSKSAMRITNTVWWFFENLRPDDTLLRTDMATSFPPSKHRPFPRNDGTDLIGRHFIEPELGICIILAAGPVVVKKMNSRAMAHRSKHDDTNPIPLGPHFTLTYRQLDTGEEHYSSIMEILSWIELGPILQPPPTPPVDQTNELPITTPSYVPASIQYVPVRPHTNLAPIPITV
jgi:hypothetical protein